MFELFKLFYSPRLLRNLMHIEICISKEFLIFFQTKKKQLQANRAQLKFMHILN